MPNHCCGPARRSDVASLPSSPDGWSTCRPSAWWRRSRTRCCRGSSTETSATTVAFSHALVQSAVYESTSAQRRLLLHRRAAEVLETAAERRHQQTTPPCSTSPVTGPSWPRPTLAHRATPPEWAASRWRRGDGGHRRRRGDRPLRARRASGDGQHARASRDAAPPWRGPVRAPVAPTTPTGASRALGVADDLDDVALYGRAAIGLAATVRYGRSDPQRITVLDTAIARLGPDEGVLRPTAAAMLKRQLGFDPSESAFERRQQAARLVLDAVSRRAPQPRAAPVARHRSRLDRRRRPGGARPAEPPDHRRRVLPRNLLVLANGWYGAAWSALELADRTAWDTAVTSFTAIADEIGLPYELALASTMAASTALMEGRYGDADRHSQRAFDLSAGTDPNAACRTPHERRPERHRPRRGSGDGGADGLGPRRAGAGAHLHGRLGGHRARGGAPELAYRVARRAGGARLRSRPPRSGVAAGDRVLLRCLRRARRRSSRRGAARPARRPSGAGRARRATRRLLGSGRPPPRRPVPGPRATGRGRGADAPSGRARSSTGRRAVAGSQ